jgi:hypothetical protein
MTEFSSPRYGLYGVSGARLIVILILLIVIIAVLALPRVFAGNPGVVLTWLSWLLNVVIAIVATIAFLPYVYNIYPIPRHSPYYATVAHTMWLPTEKLVLSSGKMDYGYILASGSGWFTVLTAPSRTIAYIPAGDVAVRAVCQPKSERQPQSYPPLITTLYTPPPHIAPCTSRGRATSIRSIRSQGESLKLIASIVHVFPGRIISVTNSYQHEQLSSTLRVYERAHDWKAPTPAGQHFWYYPPRAP